MLNWPLRYVDLELERPKFLLENHSNIELRTEPIQGKFVCKTSIVGLSLGLELIDVHLLIGLTSLITHVQLIPKSNSRVHCRILDWSQN